MDLYVFVSLHTKKHMASQSLLAEAPPPLVTQHKTKQVLSPEQPNVNPPPPHCTPLLQLSTKRLPGQQSRLRGFIKLSFASLYCPIEGPCKQCWIGPMSNTRLPLSAIPQSLWGLVGLWKAYISRSLIEMWESGEKWKERQEGAGIEYQVEKEVTPRKCEVEEMELKLFWYDSKSKNRSRGRKRGEGVEEGIPWVIFQLL